VFHAEIRYTSIYIHTLIQYPLVLPLIGITKGGVKFFCCHVLGSSTSPVRSSTKYIALLGSRTRNHNRNHNRSYSFTFVHIRLYSFILRSRSYSFIYVHIRSYNTFLEQPLAAPYQPSLSRRKSFRQAFA